MRVKESIKQILINRENRIYQKELAKKKLSYQEWAEQDEKKKRVSCAGKTEEFVVWKLAGGSLAKEALSQLCACFAAHPKAQILYGDEDVRGKDGVRHTPWVKPCWSPDTYLSYFYIGSVIAVRKSLLEESKIHTDGEIIEFASAEEIRPLMDELLTKAGAFTKGTRAVKRVPYVLFHAESKEKWNTHFACSAVSQPVKERPEISVIIPSKDNPTVLKQCLDALQKQKARFEILVVDNGSSKEIREKIETFTKGIKYIYEPMEFNFSKMCNLGAKQASAPVLFFLNDDIELCENGWLDAMLDKCRKKYTGAVGLKLYYPDSNLLQHAGVVNLPIGPDHKLRMMPDDRDYYFGWGKVAYNCIAVTAACLMIEADKFWEVGGFTTELAVCYNDVDLCFKLYKKGYQNVVVNEYFAYHHESLSRGTDEKPEKLARFRREWNTLYALHPDLRNEDPYFPEELDRWILNNKIKPAYFHGMGGLQAPSWQKISAAENIRYDQCLMARLEICDSMRMQGYAVVLGDDNACYKRYVVLSPDTDAETISANSRIMQAEGMYRYELEENIPDQKNVALCGFSISRKEDNLEPGNYKVGILAVHKVTGSKLFNWCGKVIDI